MWDSQLLYFTLCKIDHLKEAVKVLKDMTGAGCIPDLNCYGTLFGERGDLRMTADVLKMMKKLVTIFSLSPGQGTVMKVAAAFRANKETWKAVKMIEYLESEDVYVGFDLYDV